jgi:triosephosphate isomerase
MPDDERPIFAANWKMHMGPAEAKAFVGTFSDLHAEREGARVVFFPPYLSVAAFLSASGSRRDLEVGVQDVHQEVSGAHTGAVSALMGRQAGVSWALAGHSERRREFGDDDERVAAKISRILEASLHPVLCVGETLQEREAGQLDSVLSRQLATVLEGLSPEEAGLLTYAYEPVWAIGTGRTASPADAAEAHGIVRREIARCCGSMDAPILYGGSVKPGNIEELLATPGVGGVLVGGASLDPDGFASICAAGI